MSSERWKRSLKNIEFMNIGKMEHAIGNIMKNILKEDAVFAPEKI